MENKEIDQYLSDKIKVLSFFSILMVLYVHMNYTEGNNYITYKIISNFISKGIGCIAVPLFYIISGFLFFRNTSQIQDIFKKQKKRFNTLVIPYIITNIFVVFFYISMNIIANQVYFVNNVVNFKILNLFEKNNYDIVWILKYIFIDPPVAFQLWFLRDLIIIMIITPILFYIYKFINKNIIFVIIYFIALLFLIFTNIIEFKTTIIYSIFFFSIGSILTQNNIVKLHHKYPLSIGIFFCILCLLLCVTDAFIVEKLVNIPKIHNIFKTTTGIIGIWIVYDYIFSNDNSLEDYKKIKIWCNFTFFIYLFHEPIMNILKKIPLIFNKEEITIIIAYLIIPIIFTVIMIFIGNILKRKMNIIYNIITGYR